MFFWGELLLHTTQVQARGSDFGNMQPFSKRLLHYEYCSKPMGREHEVRDGEPRGCGMEGAWVFLG